eukprot:TRINITY_DN1061_c0_g1_i2.p1 TRINITY_DN1061_c0_g1~~TRINITY_DN1061_c0_g1_i2.p1  ORF type:complete len:2138 (+),score=695.79 TRINITY_DN1061_c0_g1_i2:75-6488(+)
MGSCLTAEPKGKPNPLQSSQRQEADAGQPGRGSFRREDSDSQLSGSRSSRRGRQHAAASQPLPPSSAAAGRVRRDYKFPSVPAGDLSTESSSQPRTPVRSPDDVRFCEAPGCGFEFGRWRRYQCRSCRGFFCNQCTQQGQEPPPRVKGGVLKREVDRICDGCFEQRRAGQDSPSSSQSRQSHEISMQQLPMQEAPHRRPVQHQPYGYDDDSGAKPPSPVLSVGGPSPARGTVYGTALTKHHPDWQPDTDACTRCGREYSYLPPMVRRHHCRRCGACVCGRCSEHSLLMDTPESSLPQKSRICERCFIKTVAELGPVCGSPCATASHRTSMGSMPHLGRRDSDSEARPPPPSRVQSDSEDDDPFMRPSRPHAQSPVPVIRPPPSPRRPLQSPQPQPVASPHSHVPDQQSQATAASGLPVGSAVPQSSWRLLDSCGLCTTPFTLLKRRHHCRHCGNSVCNSCSSGRVRLSNVVGDGVSETASQGSQPGMLQRVMGRKPKPSEVCRVCDSCYEKLRDGPPVAPPPVRSSDPAVLPPDVRAMLEGVWTDVRGTASGHPNYSIELAPRGRLVFIQQGSSGEFRGEVVPADLLGDGPSGSFGPQFACRILTQAHGQPEAIIWFRLMDGTLQSVTTQGGKNVPGMRTCTKLGSVRSEEQSLASSVQVRELDRSALGQERPAATDRAAAAAQDRSALSLPMGGSVSSSHHDSMQLRRQLSDTPYSARTVPVTSRQLAPQPSGSQLGRPPLSTPPVRPSLPPTPPPPPSPPSALKVPSPPPASYGEPSPPERSASPGPRPHTPDPPRRAGTPTTQRSVRVEDPGGDGGADDPDRAASDLLLPGSVWQSERFTHKYATVGADQVHYMGGEGQALCSTGLIRLGDGRVAVEVSDDDTCESTRAGAGWIEWQDGDRWTITRDPALVGLWGQEGTAMEYRIEPAGLGGMAFLQWMMDGKQCFGEVQRAERPPRGVSAEWCVKLSVAFPGSESAARAGTLWLHRSGTELRTVHQGADGKVGRAVAERRADVRELACRQAVANLWVCPPPLAAPTSPVGWLGSVAEALRKDGIRSLAFTAGAPPQPPEAAGFACMRVPGSSLPSLDDVASVLRFIDSSIKRGSGVVVLGNHAVPVAAAYLTVCHRCDDRRAVRMILDHTGYDIADVDEVTQALRVWGPDLLRLRPTSPSQGEQPDRVIGELVERGDADWQPDGDALCCKSCRKTFSSMRWRHHCRSCGLVVCDSCSKRRARLRPRNGGEPQKVRICDRCHSRLSAQRDSGSFGLHGAYSPTNTTYSFPGTRSQSPMSDHPPLADPRFASVPDARFSSTTPGGAASAAARTGVVQTGDEPPVADVQRVSWDTWGSRSGLAASTGSHSPPVRSAPPPAAPPAAPVPPVAPRSAPTASDAPAGSASGGLTPSDSAVDISRGPSSVGVVQAEAAVVRPQRTQQPVGSVQEEADRGRDELSGDDSTPQGSPTPRRMTPDAPLSAGRRTFLEAVGRLPMDEAFTRYPGLRAVANEANWRKYWSRPQGIPVETLNQAAEQYRGRFGGDLFPTYTPRDPLAGTNPLETLRSDETDDEYGDDETEEGDGREPFGDEPFSGTGTRWLPPRETPRVPGQPHGEVVAGVMFSPGVLSPGSGSAAAPEGAPPPPPPTIAPLSREYEAPDSPTTDGGAAEEAEAEDVEADQPQPAPRPRRRRRGPRARQAPAPQLFTPARGGSSSIGSGGAFGAPRQGRSASRSTPPRRSASARSGSVRSASGSRRGRSPSRAGAHSPSARSRSNSASGRRSRSGSRGPPPRRSSSMASGDRPAYVGIRGLGDNRVLAPGSTQPRPPSSPHRVRSQSPSRGSSGRMSPAMRMPPSRGSVQPAPQVSAPSAGAVRKRREAAAAAPPPSSAPPTPPAPQPAPAQMSLGTPISRPQEAPTTPPQVPLRGVLRKRDPAEQPEQQQHGGGAASAPTTSSFVVSPQSQQTAEEWHDIDLGASDGRPPPASVPSTVPAMPHPRVRDGVPDARHRLVEDGSSMVSSHPPSSVLGGSGFGAAFFGDAKPEAVWQNGRECNLCGSGFTMFRRRHHCRRCASSCCDTCSRRKLPLRKPGKGGAGASDSGSISSLPRTHNSAGSRGGRSPQQRVFGVEVEPMRVCNRCYGDVAAAATR